MKLVRFCIIFATFFLFAACHRTAKPIKLHGSAQGTYYSITYYDPDRRNLQPQIDSILADFDLTASLWVDSSLIRRVNAGTDSVVNDLFAELLRLSIEMNRYTDGAFDCTVGRLVNAWGFGFSKRDDVTDTFIDSLLQYTGTQPQLYSDNCGRNVVRLPHSETSIDFNAIAQGYCTDIISRWLESQGIMDYIVDIGGEVYAHGSKPAGKPWVVGIERPAANKYDSPEVQTTITLHNQSVVTSGSYRKYYEKEGMRFSHTIDPATGRPVTHTLLSVSVVDTAAWRADALATAFMVMGLDRAKQFIAAHPDDQGVQTSFFIYNEDGEYRTYATPRFRKLKIEN